MSSSAALVLVSASTFLSRSSVASNGSNVVPPSSLQPVAKTAPVMVTHRHRATRECVKRPAPAVCLAREVEGDTATMVRFERTGMTNAVFDPGARSTRVVFSHRMAEQEQVVVLPVGDWLVDWPGAEAIETLRVRPGAHPRVAMTTRSGACQLKQDRCELVSARNLHISVTDAGGG
jgi:hypothetical protein